MGYVVEKLGLEAQLAKCLLCRQEGLDLDPGSYKTLLAQRCTPTTPVLGVRDRTILGTC